MQCSCESHIPTRSSDNHHQACTSKPATSSRSLHSHSNKLERLAAENAVVVFTLRSCCMCHVVCRLLCSLGVNPTIHEVDDDEELQKALLSLSLCNSSMQSDLHSCHSSPSSSSSSSSSNVPAVFVGGKLVGGLDKVMAAHINGSLVPLLKDAGALWL